MHGIDLKLRSQVRKTNDMYVRWVGQARHTVLYVVLICTTNITSDLLSYCHTPSKYTSMWRNEINSVKQCYTPLRLRNSMTFALRTLTPSRDTTRHLLSTLKLGNAKIYNNTLSTCITAVALIIAVITTVIINSMPCTQHFSQVMCGPKKS